MKVVFRILCYLIIAMTCIFLYMSQLGAIPFLIGAIFLFYLGIRLLIPPSKSKSDTSKKDSQDSTASLPFEIKEGSMK